MLLAHRSVTCRLLPKVEGFHLQLGLFHLPELFPVVLLVVDSLPAVLA